MSFLSDILQKIGAARAVPPPAQPGPGFGSASSTAAVPPASAPTPTAQSMTFPVTTPAQKLALATQVSKGNEDQAAFDAQPFSIKKYVQGKINDSDYDNALYAQGAKQILRKPGDGKGAYYPEATKAFQADQMNAVMGLGGASIEAEVGDEVAPVLKKIATAAKNKIIPAAEEETSPVIRALAAKATPPPEVPPLISKIAPKPAEFTLPKELSKASPRFNIGSTSFTPKFESDLDKAAYITAQKTPSKRDADFVQAVMDHTGLSEPEVRQYGMSVKDNVKNLAKNADTPGELVVPKMSPPAPAQSNPIIDTLAGKADAPTPHTPLAETPAPPELSPSVPRTPQSVPEPNPSPTPAPLPTPDQGGGAVPGESLSYTDNVPPKKEVYNTNYLGLDPQDAPPEIGQEGNQIIQDIAAKNKAANGGPLSHLDIEQYANDNQKMYNNLVSMEETKVKAAQMFNLRSSIAADANAGRFNEDFVQKMVVDQQNAAETARLLNARKMVASPEEKTNIEEMIRQLQKQGNDAQDIIDTAKKFDLTDPEQQGAFYRALDKTKLRNWVDLVRYNSMLSSPLTHMGNIAGNGVGSAVVAPIQKAVTGALDFAHAAITGSERTAFAGEAPAYLKGYIKSTSEAVGKFWDTLTGKSLGEMPDVRNIPLTDKGTKLRVVENVLKTPMTLLESMDQLFKTMTKGGEIAALQYRAGKGVLTKNIDDEAERLANYRLFRGALKDKNQGHILNAVDEVTGSIIKLTQSKNPVASTIARFTFPFVKTPMNIFKQWIEYSPLGFATTWGAANKTEQLAKAIMGTGTMVGIASLVARNQLTGAAPTTKEDADRWKAAGIQPYSVKIGDKWVSYQNMHPLIVYPFSLVTNLKDAVDGGKISTETFEKVMGAFAKTGEFLADQSYMKSIGELNQGLIGNPEKLTSFLATYPQQLIPGRALAGWIAKATDDVERQIDPNATLFQKQMQQLMTQIPGLSKDLQARVNPKTGQPIKRSNNLLNAISPVKVTNETPEGAQIERENMSKQKYSDLQDEQTKITTDEHRKALDLYWQLKQMKPGEANGRAQALKKADPALYSRLEDIARGVSKQADTDAAEIQKLNIVTGSRAKAVLRNTDKLSTPEEKKGYVQSLLDKKIINKEVIDQLGKLIKERGPQQ